jgi:endonuclease/exonuclease/phosphatase family metal-dependent hydrolase
MADCVEWESWHDGMVSGQIDESKPKLRAWERWWRLAVWAVGCVTLFWCLLVALVGQEYWVAAPVTYLPRDFLSGLLLLLAVPGWWWERRRAVLLVVGALLHQVLILDYVWPSAKEAQPGLPEWRVGFVNRGDQEDESWTEWVTAMQPDVLGFTDVRGRHGLGVAQANVGHLPFFMRVGEHALASRYPFRGTEVVRPRLSAGTGFQLGYLPAARFELDGPGGPVVVYVVHLRSPRDALSKYRRSDLWKWTLWGTPAGVNTNNTLDFYWKEQAATIAGLLERIRQETFPTLVLGDFNLPAVGPRYRELTRTLQDAHRVAGRGYGYTFPGDVQHWVAGGSPWMRIDYILANKQWRILECVTQQAAADSQHRGVFVRLQR